MLTRKCNRCQQLLPATSDVFLKDASRSLGLAYECKPCHRQRKLGRDRRTERWANMSAAQRQAATARNRKYSQTQRGRAVFLRKAYERMDACDMTSAEILEIIICPCTYCGTLERNRGLDRIDNSLPHIKRNVVPACIECNFARGDRLSVLEMLRVGAVIREVIKDRTSTEAANADHPQRFSIAHPIL